MQRPPDSSRGKEKGGEANVYQRQTGRQTDRRRGGQAPFAVAGVRQPSIKRGKEAAKQPQCSTVYQQQSAGTAGQTDKQAEAGHIQLSQELRSAELPIAPVWSESQGKQGVLLRCWSVLGASLLPVAKSDPQ